MPTFPHRHRSGQVVPALLGLAAVVLTWAYAALAQDQAQSPAPRSFDYWSPDWMVRELWGPGRMPKSMMVRLLRHTTYTQYGVQKEYQGAQSTATPGPETVAAGGKLYAQYCSGCHAADGAGDGDEGRALSPSPALLRYMITRPISVDEYLLWTIAEGGQQFGTVMPEFKERLSREEIWRVIAYLRAGFPPVSEPARKQ